MNEKEWNNVVWLMEKLKPFIALAILIFLAFSTIGLYKYNNLQREVKESCGYQKGEDVYCICDKGFVSLRDAPGNPYFNGSESSTNDLKLPEGYRD